MSYSSADLSAVVAWLRGGGSPPSFLPVTDGRVDLRGVDLAGFIRGPGRGSGGTFMEELWTVRSPRWDSIDFGGAKLAGMSLVGGRVVNCVFDDANLEGAHFASTAILKSRFHGAQLQGASLGPRVGARPGSTVWSECSFDGAVYSLDIVHRARFVKSRLTFKNWKDVTFYDCAFGDVEFAGLMRRVIFDSRPLAHSKITRAWARARLYRVTFTSCDFTMARLYDVSFDGCIFDGVDWPPNEWLLEVPCYGRAVAHIVANPHRFDRVGAHWVKVLHIAAFKIPPRRESTLVSPLNVFEHDSPDVADAYIRAFQQANAELDLPPVVVHGERPAARREAG